MFRVLNFEEKRGSHVPKEPRFFFLRAGSDERGGVSDAIYRGGVKGGIPAG